jgi:predicted RND superfamily exporter protein
MANKPVWAHWLVLALTALLFVMVARWVDLRPVVDENFFFSSGDAALQQSKKIEKWFPSQPEVILNISSSDISSSRYLSHIARLTREVQAIDSVSTVKSLTSGSKEFSGRARQPVLAPAPCRQGQEIEQRHRLHRKQRSGRDRPPARKDRARAG